MILIIIYAQINMYWLWKYNTKPCVDAFHKLFTGSPIVFNISVWFLKRIPVQ